MKTLFKALVGKNSKGLTLVELMVAISIFSLISVAITNVYLNSQNSYYYLEGSSQNTQEARFTVEQVSRDIRSTVEITSNTSSASNILEVKGDYDGSGSTETIRYYKEGTNLKRTINGTGVKTIAEGLTNNSSEFVFKYFDQDGNSTSVISQIKLIELDIRIDKNTGKGPSRSTALTTRIQLRNLHERR
jgi:prepilin-type N-terminal cleavage/methylation domain-containing protein